MARILTGIQSTGTPHLGNILGAIIPAIELSNEKGNDSYLFIADMHSLTQVKDGSTLRENTYATAATWLAFGLNPEKSVFYRQSDVPEVTELMWYLMCLYPYQRMTLAHSFKDKADRLEDVNGGLFSYPILMAADILPPKRVYSHGWLMAEDGRKMSKSFGNVIVPKDFVEKFGLDQTRFYLLREISFGQDGNIGYEGIKRRKNELANDFGNLAQRVLMFIFKNNEAKLPKITTLTADDQAMLDASGTALLETCRRHIDAQEFNLMLEAIWVVIRQANAYVDTQAPWGLKKTDTVRMETVLGVLCEVVRRVALLCHPVMPQTMDKMLDQLNVPATERSFAYITDIVGLKQCAVIEQPSGVFPRHIEEAAA